jgi:ethanolamine ammonia-lyase small subunit
MIYRPNERTVEADRTVVSNIHRGGIPPVEAGAHLVDLLKQILQAKASGVNLMRNS